MSKAFGDIVKKVKSFRTSSNSTLNPSVSAFPGPGTVDVRNDSTNLEEEMEWIEVDRKDVESIIELDQDSLDIGETQMKRLGTREDVPTRMIRMEKEDRDEGDIGEQGMDAAHSQSESNKSDPNPNPNLNKALPPLPLELEFNQSPLRLVSHSGSFQTITSSACPKPRTRIGTRTGLPASTRPPPSASAQAQSRLRPWKSRAATDNTFDFALEDLFDPDSPLQAKIARNTANRLITSTSTTTRSMPDLVIDQAAERVHVQSREAQPESEPGPGSVNQLSRSLPRSLLSMKQLETGTYRNHAFNSVDMTTDMDIGNLITDDDHDDNTKAVGVQLQIDQKKTISLVDHDHFQKSHTLNNTSEDRIERIKDQAPPLSQPNSSPLPIPGATTTTQPPIIPITAVKKPCNRLDNVVDHDDIDVEHLNSKPSQSTTPPTASSTLQQPTNIDTDTDIDIDMVPITPSARDGRLSFGPGLSEDDLQRNARVLASLARRAKGRVSN